MRLGLLFAKAALKRRHLDHSGALQLRVLGIGLATFRVAKKGSICGAFKGDVPLDLSA